MASARLKPRTNIAHVREGTIRRSRAIHAVHRRGGLHQHTNDSAERGGRLPVFGTALLVLAAVGLALIKGFMA
jgi:DNA-binding phage protein